MYCLRQQPFGARLRADCAEDLAGGDVRYAEVLPQPLGLRSLACTGGPMRTMRMMDGK